ncbi:MAG: DUF3871 family protein [Rikenellaceae bacterium]
METAMQLQQVRPNNTFFLPQTNPMEERVIEPVLTSPIIINTSKYENKPFIEANTKEVTANHLKSDCVIPVFSKDNEVTISHTAFIDTVWNAVNKMYSRETISEPDIRVSHVIKGRTPEAIHKPVNQLLDIDKTIYYERMMFAIDVPTIHRDIAGNRLNLTIGGVRAYNHENLYSKRGVEKFKLFVGFKNLVCCNMCISTDGLKSDIKVLSSDELFKATMALLSQYNIEKHLQSMKLLQDHSLSEHQFAQFIGKSRLYQCLPQAQKKLLPEMLMTDTQINLVAKSYYNDENFGVFEQGAEIDMWSVYNLLTGANKSSYIDNFLDRSLNATELSSGICQALNGESCYNWFIK